MFNLCSKPINKYWSQDRGCWALGIEQRTPLLPSVAITEGRPNLSPALGDFMHIVLVNHSPVSPYLTGRSCSVFLPESSSFWPLNADISPVLVFEQLCVSSHPQWPPCPCNSPSVILPQSLCTFWPILQRTGLPRWPHPTQWQYTCFVCWTFLNFSLWPWFLPYALVSCIHLPAPPPPKIFTWIFKWPLPFSVSTNKFLVSPLTYCSHCPYSQVVVYLSDQIKHLETQLQSSLPITTISSPSLSPALSAFSRCSKSKRFPALLSRAPWPKPMSPMDFCNSLYNSSGFRHSLLEQSDL